MSLLRVYGLTHLEQWKWDEWEEQSRARRAIGDASAAAEGSPEPPQAVHVPVVEPQKSDPVEMDKVDKEDAQQSTDSRNVVDGDRSPASALGPDTAATAEQLAIQELQRTQEAQPTIVAPPVATTASENTTVNTSTTTMNISNDPHVSHAVDSTHTSDDVPAVQSTPPSTGSTAMIAYPPASSSGALRLGSALSPDGSHTPQSSRVPSPAVNSSSAVSSVISAATTQSHSLPPAPPAIPPHISTGGESIYRTIMNRLTALEGNTTLYARYVEEQTAGIREVLLRMGEDLGRLEGIVSYVHLAPVLS